MTYVCDKCMTNRSDQGVMYHLTITKIEMRKVTYKIVKETDICAPCFDRLMRGDK
jgi:hypothetical protein